MSLEVLKWCPWLLPFCAQQPVSVMKSIKYIGEPAFFGSALAKSEPTWLHPEELKHGSKPVRLLYDCWWNNICTFATFSGQLASLAQFPFKFVVVVVVLVDALWVLATDCQGSRVASDCSQWGPVRVVIPVWASDVDNASQGAVLQAAVCGVRQQQAASDCWLDVLQLQLPSAAVSRGAFVSFCIIGGNATSIIFVATKHIFCHDKSMLAATKLCLLLHTNFCRDKHVLVATKVLSQQAYFCHGNGGCHKKYLSWEKPGQKYFVVTNILLLRQRLCFVVTNMCLLFWHVFVVIKLLSQQKYLWQLLLVIVLGPCYFFCFFYWHAMCECI